jgi:predicted RNA binding protein YcfA (HicA-like mRNA interferase family)
MSKSPEKIIQKILAGNADANIKFSELCKVLQHYGFQLRIKGSHHIFHKEDIEEIVNIQPKDDKAKPYQVKQVRQLITKYKLKNQ